jgi:exopolysaccharide production protein ExoQ
MRYSRDRQGWRAALWIGVAVSLIMLMLSYSRAAMVASAAAGGVLVLLTRPWKLQRQSLWLAGGTLALIVILAVSVFVKPAYWLAQSGSPTPADAAATEVGNLGTLVDRTVIWQQLIPIIEERPLLGYAYNSFWTGRADSPASVIRTSGGKPPGSAHNGYLEFVLDLGLIGLAVFALQLALTLIRALRQALRAESALDYWPVLLITALVVLNIAASTFMENTLAWILYVSVALGLVMTPHPAPESEDRA